MKKIITLIAALALSGCATNGEFDAGKTALLVVGVAVVGAVAASGDSSGPSSPNCHFVVGPNGSTQICR